MGNSDRL